MCTGKWSLACKVKSNDLWPDILFSSLFLSIFISFNAFGSSYNLISAEHSLLRSYSKRLIFELFKLIKDYVLLIISDNGLFISD